MAFDNANRGRLQRFVTDARALLTNEFANQFQQDYGLDPESGAVAALSSLAHLDDQRLETARILREILDHYLATEMGDKGEAHKAVLGRMVREQAFTTLNRLAALRMMEARGLVMECVGKGYQSKAFRLYHQVAGSGLGETGDAYRIFLLSLCDLYSEELPLLFDRHYPNGRLFPREPALLPLLELINAAEIEPLWAQDDDRLDLPILQRQGRAQSDAQCQPSAAQQPRACGAQPVLHAALCCGVPGGQHTRAALVQLDGRADRAARPLPVSSGEAGRGAGAGAAPARSAHHQAARPCLRLNAFRALRFRLVPGHLPRGLDLGA